MMNLRSIMGAAGNSVVNPEQVILDLSPYAFYASYANGGVNQSSGLVSQINDLTGAGRHCTQSIGARQATIGLDFQNSLNLLTLGGLSCYNGHADLYNVPKTNNTVIFLVKCADTAATIYEMFVARQSASAYWSLTMTPSVPRLTFNSRNTSASGFNTTITGPTNWNMFLGRRTSSNVSSSQNNGSESTLIGGGSDVTAIDQFTMFNVVDQNGPGAFKGLFASAIFFDRSLTPSEITTIYSYYQNRLAI